MATIFRSTMVAFAAMAMTAPLAAPAFAKGVPIETKTIDQLYKDAVAEGGTFILYAGGDFPDQFAGMKKAFETAFPGVKIEIRTDFSKFQTPRIENQIERGRLEPDYVVFQNVQDFDRWKKQGLLYDYKPADWNAIPANFKDPDGAFVSSGMVAFANVVSNQIPDAELPKSYLDYLDPKYKGKLSLTYPMDDDAILYQFKLIIGKYGWDWLEKLIANDPKWVRGTPQSNAPVRKGEMLATFTSALPVWGDAKAQGARLVLFEKDPFVLWASRGGIFKAAKHKAAAKLFLAWRLSKPQQEKSVVWSVRSDVKSPLVKPWTAYNVNPDGFLNFMRDRSAVEIFRGELEQYIGPVQGPAPTGPNRPEPMFAGK